MPGSKVPILEVEKLKVTEDGRGIVVYNDATNIVIQSASPWTGVHVTGGAATQSLGLPTASSMGWWKIHYVSSSTYGATGATCYIPVFRNLDTNTA